MYSEVKQFRHSNGETSGSWDLRDTPNYSPTELVRTQIPTPDEFRRGSMQGGGLAGAFDAWAIFVDCAWVGKYKGCRKVVLKEGVCFRVLCLPYRPAILYLCMARSTCRHARRARNISFGEVQVEASSLDDQRVLGSVGGRFLLSCYINFGCETAAKAEERRV